MATPCFVRLKHIVSAPCRANFLLRKKPGSCLRLSQSASPVPALSLGARHLSCGASHLSCWAAQSASGRGSRAAWRARFACARQAVPRGRAVGLGVRHLSCGDSHLFCGVDQSLWACTGLAARLNAYALAIPFAGALPLGRRPHPKMGKRRATLIGYRACMVPTWGVCTPIPPAPTLRHKGFGPGPHWSISKRGTGRSQVNATAARPERRFSRVLPSTHEPQSLGTGHAAGRHS